MITVCSRIKGCRKEEWIQGWSKPQWTGWEITGLGYRKEESDWILRKSCCVAKMVKHGRKIFPGRTVQFPQMMFLNKNETSICREWHRSSQLHHPRAGGRPWCFLRALQVLVTKFKISALTRFLGKPEMKAFLLRQKPHRFPVLTSNPRRNVKISYSWVWIPSYWKDSLILCKAYLHCKLLQHCLIFTSYSICHILSWRNLQHVLIQNRWYLSGMLTGWTVNWLLQLWLTRRYLYLISVVLFRYVICDFTETIL